MTAKILKQGIVEEALPGLCFKVKLYDNEVKLYDNEVKLDNGLVLAYLSGKMKIHYIKVIPGDRVMVELSPYDKNRGRIIKRF